MNDKKIAIIGAGIAGLTLAHKLKEFANIKVFEKSRSPGGKLATRYDDTKKYYFDHAVPFFTAKSPEFKEFLAPMIEDGIITPWNGKFSVIDINKPNDNLDKEWTDALPHYVGTPNMNVIGQYLAKGLDISLNTRINNVFKEGTKWKVISDNNEDLGLFDWIVFAIPSNQAAEFLPPCKYLTIIKKIHMKGCFSLLLGIDDSNFPMTSDIIITKNHPILGMILANHRKPGRNPDNHSLVVHSNYHWGEKNIDSEQEQVKLSILHSISVFLNYDLSEVTKYSHLQTWKYAHIPGKNQTKKLKKQPLRLGEIKIPKNFIDSENQIALCGDWTDKTTVESGFKSANSLTEKMLKILGM